MPVNRRPRRRVGRPRGHANVRRLNQPGGQFGLLGPILKVVAPLIVKEIAKFGIQTGLKKLTGKGMAGNGLRLAGQTRGRGPGVRARRKPMRRRAPARRRRKPANGAHILPFPLPPGLKF